MTCVALVRGINVGGRSLLMADLRGMLTALGFTDARTILQSGNAIFSTTMRSAEAVERRLEAESTKRFGFQTPYYVRTDADWQRIVRDNPLPEIAAREPSRLILTCFREPIAPKTLAALQAVAPGREVVRGGGRELYIHYPDGMGVSKLTPVLIDKTLGQPGTARNWNTVLRILSGTSGTSGTPGTSGTSGTPGTSGTLGTPGTSGTRGARGGR